MSEREIRVGIRIDNVEGISFTGIDEVNGLLNRGGKVTGLEPGGALMQKLGDEDGHVRLTLSGCEMKVMVDDSAVAASPESMEHDRLYKEGSALISPYMELADRASESGDGDTMSDDLKQGVELLSQALLINPANWAALWILGKAHQVLGDSEDAFHAFAKSFGLQKENADVAREYMLECLRLGHVDKGMAAAQHAVALEPENGGLVANLALALLIGGRLDDATIAVGRALELDPNDRISRHLQQTIAEVKSGQRPQPETLADLEP